jgi:hypothetical protein
MTRNSCGLSQQLSFSGTYLSLLRKQTQLKAPFQNKGLSDKTKTATTLHSFREIG